MKLYEMLRMHGYGRLILKTVWRKAKVQS